MDRTGVTILTGLTMMTGWIGWLLMILVGNLYHDGVVQGTLGFWDAQRYGFLLVILLALPYAALVVVTAQQGGADAPKGPPHSW